MSVRQVVDLGDQRPEDGLEWCHLVGPERCRVLVAGGDGTVDWVLNAIENLQLQVRGMLRTPTAGEE